MTMKLSERGAVSIAAHEGLVTKAYRCPAGVVTIGVGYTNRSKAFRAYWNKTRGRDLRMGDKIDRKEALDILPMICAQEYGAAVNKALGGKSVPQNVFDACVSVVFNCGPRALNWSWFTDGVSRGKFSEAARRLRTTAITAKGKRLQGLVNRRAAEADMLENARYGLHGQGVARTIAKSPKTGNPEIMAYQEKLASLGHKIKADGWWGPASAAALKDFQQKYPHLKNDGRLGPASRAEIDRAIIEEKSTRAPSWKADDENKPFEGLKQAPQPTPHPVAKRGWLSRMMGRR